MHYLTLSQVLEIHRLILAQSGGAEGLRSLDGLESAVAQPTMSFDGTDLYPTVLEKAAALCFSLVNNHPFVDGNKRVAHAALETMLVLNGFEIRTSVDEQEAIMLELAAGTFSREQFIEWLYKHVISLK